MTKDAGEARRDEARGEEGQVGADGWGE
ncbi:hypothetical protein E2C01_093702 [Portunus trituberculatus]|uniref:Uncharacterized protein n=1 Tax=Portunus trituberculatus TaxID=210409 RepID=A0A5B7JVJ2_PORTR|nr:hypothetical protein [Portunus trituberculatus]